MTAGLNPKIVLFYVGEGDFSFIAFRKKSESTKNIGKRGFRNV